MILLELVARRLARRVLVLTLPSLIEQWQGELGSPRIPLQQA